MSTAPDLEITPVVRSPGPVGDGSKVADRIAAASGRSQVSNAPDPEPDDDDDDLTPAGDDHSSGPDDATESTEPKAPSGEFAGQQAAVAATWRDALPPEWTPALAELDDQAAATRLVETVRAAQTQIQEQAAQYRQHLAYYQNQLTQRQEVAQQAAQQRATEVPPKPKWQAKEFDPAWVNLLKQDETGNIVAVPGAAPDLPEKYRAYQDWKRQNETKFWSDPAAFIQEQVADYVRQTATEVAQQHQQQYQQSQMGDQLWKQNSYWMQANDPLGQPLIDPISNRAVLTAEGQRAKAYMEEAIAHGADFFFAFNQAKERVIGDLARVVATAPRKADPNAAQQAKNQQFLKNAATRKPNQNGTRPRPEFGGQPTSNAKLDFTQMAMADLQAAGIQPGDKLF